MYYKDRFLTAMDKLKKCRESRSDTLRTKKTQDEYMDYLENEYDGECILCHNEVKKEHKYWIEVVNDFPYDSIFESQVLLTPKEHKKSIKELTLYEIEELYDIMEVGEYDMMIYNAPSKQSQIQHLHYHMCKLK